MDEIIIPYKPKYLIFILVILLFGLAAAFLFYLAKNNDQGIILYRIIEFSPTGASYFLALLGVASLGFVLMGVLAIVRGLTTERMVVISADSLSAPKSGISKRIVSVKFKDIQSLNVQSVQKTRILHIHHAAGRLTIPNSMIPGKTGFDELVNLINARVDQAAGA